MSFEKWMQLVDREIARICGVGYMDLGDQMYHDWFDEGWAPREAAYEALENEGFPFE